MTLGKRPGGLTALAVLNFVFGGIGAIVALLGFAGLSLIREAIKKAEQSGMPYDGQSLSVAYAVIGMTAFGAILLIASGVGYIRQTKTGRALGNIYVLVSLGGTALSIATAGFGVGSLLLVVYPLVTLILINSAFKANLVR